MTPLRTLDPLSAPATWIGTTFTWVPGPAAGRIVITLAADPQTLDTAALPIYREVARQLVRASAVQLSITSSIDAGSGPVLDAAAQPAIAAYVEAVISYLADKTTRLPAPVTIAGAISQAIAGVPPMAATVTLVLSCLAPAEFSAAADTPSASIPLLDTPVMADFSGDATAFAASFRQAFPDLRLGTGPDSSVWAVGADLTQPIVTATPDCICFAPAPLADGLLSGAVDIPQFGDFARGEAWPVNPHSFTAVDSDGLLFATFANIDRVLAAGPLATAAAKVNPAAWDTLVKARSALAENYAACQLGRLFDAPAQILAADPVLPGARLAYLQLLRSALASAYMIDAVVALDVNWAMPSTVPAEKVRSLRSTLRSAGDRGSSTVTTALLQIDDFAALRGRLYCNIVPRNYTADASMALPHEIAVTHLAFNASASAASTCLALLIPETLTIGNDPSNAPIQVPLVNRFFPAAPVPIAEAAIQAAVPASTFSELFEWTHTATMLLQPAAQDVALIDIITTSEPRITPVNPPNPAPSFLASALVRFQSGFSQIASALDDVSAENPKSANIVAALADLVSAVQETRNWSPPPDATAASASTDPSLDRASIVVSFFEDAANPGTWFMTADTDPALGSRLTVLPLSSDGAPQPATKIVRRDPLLASYQPADPSAPVMVEISLAKIDVRTTPRAGLEARVIRNARLRADVPSRKKCTVASRYLRETPAVTLSNLIGPNIIGPTAGYDIATAVTPPASGLLTDWLLEFLRAIFGPMAEPCVGLSVSYAYPLGDGLTSRTPILLVPPMNVDNVGSTGTTTPDFAQALAGQILAWWRMVTPFHQGGGDLEFDLVLTTWADGQTTEFLRAPNLRLSVAAVRDLP